MQSSLRAVVLIFGVLLMVAAVVMFGQQGGDASDAAAPTLLAFLGAVVFAVGLFMPEHGLLRRTDTTDHPLAGIDDLEGTSPQDE